MSKLTNEAQVRPSENLNELLGLGYIVIFTDGTCPNNGSGGPGAAAAIIHYPGRPDVDGTYTTKTFSEYLPSATNQRAEIVGVCVGLERMADNSRVIVFSDSEYVVKTCNGEYRRKKNLEYWDRLDQAVRGKNVKFFWVRAHNGDEWNEAADQAADECLKDHTKRLKTLASFSDWLDAERRDRR